MGAGLAEHPYETFIAPEDTMSHQADIGAAPKQERAMDAVVRAGGSAVGGLAIGSAIGLWFASSAMVAVTACVFAVGAVAFSVFDSMRHAQ